MVVKDSGAIILLLLFPNLRYSKYVCNISRRRFGTMIRSLRSCFLCISRNAVTVVLSLVFLAGLIYGTYLSLFVDPSVFSLMRMSASCHVSIVGFLSALLLPVAFSAFAIYISCVPLLFLVAFLKAFVFSFLSSGFLLALGDSGWLLRILFMFSDLASLPLLCWLWMHICNNGRGSNLRCAVVVLFVICGIGYLDYYCVSPFLANLIL